MSLLVCGLPATVGGLVVSGWTLAALLWDSPTQTETVDSQSEQVSLWSECSLVVDGGGGLHGDGDGDGGGGLHGNCCQVRRPHVASSNLALVVCGCHRVYCSLGASRRCRGDLVRSTNTPKTPGVMWRCSGWSRSTPGVMWTIPGAMWRWQCLECLSELIL